jgi:hypothetical protein
MLDFVEPTGAARRLAGDGKHGSMISRAGTLTQRHNGRSYRAAIRAMQN